MIGKAWPWLAAVLTGCLLTLCFPRWNQAWLCWIALGPLLGAVWFVKGDRPRLKRAALGYCAGLFFFWGTFSWLTTVTGLGWFLLAFYLALYFAFWGWFAGEAFDWLAPRSGPDRFASTLRNIGIATLCATGWTAQEWVRGWMFTGFGWNGLGVALHEHVPMIQIADLTGVGGISYLIVFCNVLAFTTVGRLAEEARVGRVRLRPRWDFSLALILAILVFAYGVRAMWRPIDSTPLKVAAVQANIPQDQKWDEAFESRIMERYKSLTELALVLQPQLLIWPEAATPRPVFADEVNFRFVMKIAERGQFNFLLGTLDEDANVAMLLRPGGREYDMYRKMHLVPFGEYIPFRHSFPLFAWVVGDLVPADFTAGEAPAILRTEAPAVRVGPLICFEDTVGRLTRRFVLEGAQLLVNVTNDGWFQRSAGAEQHLANAVFRAVENHRPLVRAANTGVTCFVSPTGMVTQRLELFREGTLSGQVEVPTNGPLTFYTRFGEVFSGATAAITALVVLLRCLPLGRRNR